MGSMALQAQLAQPAGSGGTPRAARQGSISEPSFQLRQVCIMLHVSTHKMLALEPVHPCRFACMNALDVGDQQLALLVVCLVVIVPLLS